MALPLDELELISKKLTFAPDYTRFRSICKAWRSAAPKHPQLPWLIATAVNCSNFYHFCFEANKFIQIPQLSTPSLLSSFLDKPHVFIRSSHGWLFLLDLHTKSASLMNPLTNSIISLPKLRFVKSSGCKYDIVSHKFGFSLTSDPGESLPDCFAVVYCSARICYCKVGSSSVWSVMRHPEFHRRGNSHMCCYRGKLFLGLGAHVFVCEFGDNPSICKLVSLESRKFVFQETYFVESDGDLLVVLVLDLRYRTCKVFKLESGRRRRQQQQQQEEEVKVVELKCLGDTSLFLGVDTTFSLLASKYPGCKKNCIYIPEFLGSSDEQTIIPRVIIYDCEEGDCTSLPNNDRASWQFIPCAWFRPSLLM